MTHIEQRTDEAAVLASVNPIPHRGEAVHESDTGKWKLGDGVLAYNDLPYKGGVDSVAGQTGEVELDVTDVAGAAPLASPVFTGNPKAPTRATSDNSTDIATTAFVKAAIALLTTGAPGLLDDFNEVAAAIGDNPNFATDILATLATKAPLASPAFTGNPTAPTPVNADNDTSIATTAFVKSAAPRGWIGYAQKTTGQGGWTTDTDATSLSVTVDLPASRRIKITAFARLYTNTVGDAVYLSIKEGVTYLQSAEATVQVVDRSQTMTPAVVLTPSAGLHTYRLALARTGTGTGTLFASSSDPAFILVEDIGPA